MTRKFLLEQLNRSEACTLDENKLHEKDNKQPWMIHHNTGHAEVVNMIRKIISNNEYIDIKSIKNKIRKRRKFNSEIIEKLDEKYNHFQDDDVEMSADDNFLYHFSDGMNCEFETILRILNKKQYYSKDSYNPTNWDEIFK